MLIFCHGLHSLFISHFSQDLIIGDQVRRRLKVQYLIQVPRCRPGIAAGFVHASNRAQDSKHQEKFQCRNTSRHNRLQLQKTDSIVLPLSPGERPGKTFSFKNWKKIANE